MMIRNTDVESYLAPEAVCLEVGVLYPLAASGDLGGLTIPGIGGGEDDEDDF